MRSNAGSLINVSISIFAASLCVCVLSGIIMPERNDIENSNLKKRLVHNKRNSRYNYFTVTIRSKIKVIIS